MKKLFIGVVAMATTLLVGCGQSFYPTDNHNLVATNVHISEANFRVVGLVEGQAKATYILGIGGLSGKALRSNAYSDMVRKANLKGSQMIVNATIHQMHYGLLPLRWTQTVKYQGTVIEFINPNQPNDSVNESDTNKKLTPITKKKAEPAPKKNMERPEKKKDKKSATDNKKREVKTDKVEISAESLGETKMKEIDSMSKFKRENYLTDLSTRINRLCGSKKSINENRERIEEMMTEMKYILEKYECRQAFYNSYNKYVETLNE